MPMRGSHVSKAELRVGQLLARARWRRCFAFSLAFRLFARIVLLDLTVLFTWSSDLDAAALSYPLDRRWQRRASGRRRGYGPWEGPMRRANFDYDRQGGCRIARGEVI
jgi:hypothetical protein